MKIFPILIKKITTIVSGGAANVTWNETVDLSDPLMSEIVIGSDTEQLTDGFAKIIAFEPDIDQKADSLVVSGTIPIPDTEQFADAGAITVQWTEQSRSGTPDSDSWGDAWTDSTVGQTGVNHGNDSTGLHVNGAATGTKTAFIEVDLTRFAGLSAAAAGGSLFITYTNGNVGTVSGAIAYSTLGNRIFTESTITQSNQPTVSNALASLSFTVATNQGLSIPISQAVLAAMLGNWVCFKITGGLAQTVDITVGSRETANPAVLTMNISR